MKPANKTQGFLLLLIFVWLGTFFLNDGFASEYNSRNLIRYCSMFGIIGVGVLFVIVTGGIDLSLGSAIGLIGGSLVLLLRLNPVESLRPLGENESKVVWFFWVLVGLKLLFVSYWIGITVFAKNFRVKKLMFPVCFLFLSLLSIYAMWVAQSDLPNTTRIPWIFFLLISISLFVGLLHGVLITLFQLQPFVVTLGGLLCYRGLIRWLTNDSTQGLGSGFDDSLRLLAKGEICSVATLMLFAGLVVFGAYLYRLLFSGDSDSDRKRNSWVGMICGLLVALIGSSRFWNGVGRENFTELFNVQLFGFIPVQFSTWETVVSEAAVARPQWLMQWAWIPLIPVGLGLLAGLFATDENEESGKFQFDFRIALDLIWFPQSRRLNRWNHVFVSIVGLIVSTTLLWFACKIPNGSYELNVSEETQWWIEMVSVFGSLALVMVSISRLGSCVQMHGRDLAKFCFPIMGLLAALAVVGTTQLPSTLVQTPFFVMVLLALFALIVFEHTVFGRYLLAIGNNEDAARYSGIDTQQVTVAAYVICSGIIGIAAIIFMLDFNSVAPTGFGSFYELYAIAAVVLGGCSLRGGEANVLGVLLGAAIMRVLANAPDMIDLPKTLEYAILGLVIVVGVVVDERIRRRSQQQQ